KRILASDPQQVTVTVWSSEPLLESSITIAQASASGGDATICEGLVVADDRSSFTCPSLRWTGPTPDTRMVQVSGTDLAGNAFDLAFPIRDLSGVAPTGASLQVVSAVPNPQIPNPSAYEIPVRLELANVGDADACSPYITS